MIEISLPRIVRVGGGVLNDLPEVLARCGLSRPFVVTDAFLVQSGMVARMIDVLESAGLSAQVRSLPRRCPIRQWPRSMRRSRRCA